MANELSRAALARRGLIFLVAVGVFAAFISLRSNGTFGSSPHVVAHVTTAGGALRAGSDVKVDGAIVGRVHSIEPADGGGVDIDLLMSEDHLSSIPGNVVARILPATVFGTTFVDLVVHGGASGELKAGAEIKPDTSQGTLELQQALDDIDRLVKALGPRELAQAIGSASQALDGRGGEIRAILTSVNAYLTKLNPRMPQVRNDLAKLADSMDVINDVAPDLLDAAADGLVFLDSLVSQEAQLTTLVTGGISLAITARKFLTKNQANLVRFINDSAILVDALYDNRQAGITGAITENINIGQKLPSVLKDGVVYAKGPLSITTGEPTYYGSGSRPSYARASMSNVGGRGR